MPQRQEPLPTALSTAAARAAKRCSPSTRAAFNSQARPPVVTQGTARGSGARILRRRGAKANQRKKRKMASLPKAVGRWSGVWCRAGQAPKLAAARARTQTAMRALGTSGGNPVEYMNPHRSDAEALIAAVPVIKVKGNVATCNGGGGALGHPIEYITLNTVDPTIPTDCKYCGLRFVRDPDFHH